MTKDELAKIVQECVEMASSAWWNAHPNRRVYQDGDSNAVGMLAREIIRYRLKNAEEYVPEIEDDILNI